MGPLIPNQLQAWKQIHVIAFFNGNFIASGINCSYFSPQALACVRMSSSVNSSQHNGQATYEHKKQLKVTLHIIQHCSLW